MCWGSNDCSGGLHSRQESSNQFNCVFLLNLALFPEDRLMLVLRGIKPLLRIRIREHYLPYPKTILVTVIKHRIISGISNKWKSE